jgi:hypothetical protein
MQEKRTAASGAKRRQRDDTENRALKYLFWRNALPPIPDEARKPFTADVVDSTTYSNWHYERKNRGLYMTDIDFIEWRYNKHKELVAVGLMEVTRVDQGIEVNDVYTNQILSRYKTQLQGQAARKIAEALNTKAYIVLFRDDCTEFWIYCLTDNWKAWKTLTAATMEAFLNGLTARKKSEALEPQTINE